MSDPALGPSVTVINPYPALLLNHLTRHMNLSEDVTVACETVEVDAISIDNKYTHFVFKLFS